MTKLDIKTMSQIQGGALQHFCAGFIAGFGIGAGIVGAALVSNPIGLTVGLVGVALCLSGDS